MYPHTLFLEEKKKERLSGQGLDSCRYGSRSTTRHYKNRPRERFVSQCMNLCDIQQNFKDVCYLRGRGFQTLTDAYFRNITSDIDDYHWSQSTLHLLTRTIRALEHPQFHFVVQCYTGLLTADLESGANFREFGAHVFLVNAFAAIYIGKRSQSWNEQFLQTVDLFKLLANISSHKAIVVLLRCLSHPPTAGRLRSQVLKIATHYVMHYDTYMSAHAGTVSSAAQFASMDAIHSRVPTAEAVYVPPTELLNALDLYILGMANRCPSNTPDVQRV